VIAVSAPILVSFDIFIL